MENDETISTLKVKICGSIESAPDTNREKFKQSVIDTVLHILRTENVSIEYIGYKPDTQTELEQLVEQSASYEDCVYVSLNVRDANLNPMDEDQTKDDIIRTFVEVFENITHRNLEIDSTIVRKEKKLRIIEMSSDWKYYLEHG